MGRDHNASGLRFRKGRFVRNDKVTRLSHRRVKGLYRPPESGATPPPKRISTLEVSVLQNRHGGRAQIKGLGIVVSMAFAGIAGFALMHAVKNVDYGEVFDIVRRTNTGFIALALALVAASYASLT